MKKVLNKIFPRTNSWQKAVVFGILATIFILLIILAKTDSLTADEKIHLPAGYLHTWEGNYSYNVEHPPLANDLSGLFIKLAHPQVPQDIIVDQWQYGEGFIYATGQNTAGVIFWGRFPIIILTILLLYLVYLWASELWGFQGGLVSLLLAASCPNLLSHGHIATTDLILAFSYTLNFYILWKFTKDYSWKNAIYLGLATGFVLLSKFSSIIVLPLNLVILAGYLYFDHQNLVLKIKKTIVSLFISILTLYLVYLFSMRGEEMRWVYFEHYNLNHFQFSRLYFVDLLKWLLWPFKKYRDGLDVVQGHNKIGHLSYLNGVFQMQGRWQYFFYAFYYKTPIPAIILFFFSLILFFKSKIAKITPLIFVLLPGLVFFIFSVKGNIDIGIRHALPVYPLAYIFIGSITLVKDKVLRWLTFILVGANIIVMVFAYPQYLSYFNQFAGGTKGGIKHLSDSNLDWNQNVGRFSQYLKKEKIESVYLSCYDVTSPTYYGIKFKDIPKIEPVKGIVAMCAQQYLVSKIITTDYRWFINTPPTKIVDGTIYLWDLR